MVVDTGLYDILGVHPNSSEKEIREAYKQKAFELHPDKNKVDPKATQKFQKINYAYEILSDKLKREKYDKYGIDNFNEDDESGKPSMPKVSNTIHEIEVTLSDLYNGGIKKINLIRANICSLCKGEGMIFGDAYEFCPQCMGLSKFLKNYCQKCDGIGHVPCKKYVFCGQCNGTKIDKKEISLNVHIEPGMKEGDEIIFQGMGNEIPGHEPGDLIIKLKYKEHEFLKRVDDNLIMSKTVTISEVLLGTELKFTHLDGREFLVKASSETQIIKGEGMPGRGMISHGDLIINYKINFPTPIEITPELRKALNDWMPSIDSGTSLNIEENINSQMIDFDITDVSEIESIKVSEKDIDEINNKHKNNNNNDNSNNNHFNDSSSVSDDNEEEEEEKDTLFIPSLPLLTDADDLLLAFKDFNPIRAKVVRSFGFVQFNSFNDMNKALSQKYVEIDFKKCRIKISRTNLY